MSKRFQHAYIYIIFVGILTLAIPGCYTAFQHPPISNDSWGQVRVSDDCLECHETEPNQQHAYLPQAAETDYNWIFYSGSPWWQDEYTIADELGASTAPEPTGPRSFNSTPTYPGPVVAPATVPTVPSLGKTDASTDETQESEQSNKRSFGRRQPTTSESKDSDSSSKRSRRR